jgi:hypothetical protein
VSGHFDGAMIGVVTVLAPHQERVLVERAELDARIGKLREFTMTEKFIALEDEEKILLLEQLNVMLQYSALLAARIKRF